jgi:hypothetical protein
MTNNNERLAIVETKVDALVEDVAEIKKDMKSHLEQSQKYNDKITDRINMILWAILVGACSILAKMVFFP